MHSGAPEAPMSVNRPLARDDSVNESNVASARVTRNSLVSDTDDTLLRGGASEAPVGGDIDLNGSIGPQPGGNSTANCQSSVRDRAVRDDFKCPICKRSDLPASFSVPVRRDDRSRKQCIECRAVSCLYNEWRRPNGPFHGVPQSGLRDTARRYLEEYFKKWEKKLSFPRPPKKVVDKMVLNVTARFEAKLPDKRQSAISSSTAHNVPVQAEGDILNPPNVVQFISDTADANSTRSALQIEDSVEADTIVPKKISKMEEVSRNLRNRLKPHVPFLKKLERDEERVLRAFWSEFAAPWISIADYLDNMRQE